MAHSRPNGRGPHENSPPLLNLSISWKDTGEELHSEGWRIGFHREKREAIDNKGEFFIFYRKEGVISLRKGRTQLQEGPERFGE